MSLNIAGTLRGEFRHRAEIAHRQRILHERRQKLERRERQEQIEEEAAEFTEMVLAFVTTSEITQFRAEIDTYDAATVAALQENGHSLELLQERLDQLLSQAFVLNDGRRVFKSEDGLQVFDEHGIELDATTIDPDLIPDDRPTWEEYKSTLDEKTRLLEERRALIDYQAKLDDTRERLDAGDITQVDFDKLRERLKTSMPEAVRRQIPGMEAEQRATAAAEPKPDIDLDFSPDTLPSSMVPDFH